MRQTGGRGQYGHVRDRDRAQRAGRRLRVREPHHGRRHPARLHPRGRPGHPGGHDHRRAGRLPHGRHQGRSSSTAPTTTSTRPSWPSRSPARWRSRRAPSKAQPVLLEPMMAVEVVTPAEFMGDVMGDLNSRRGHIDGMEQRGNAQVITATVPLVHHVRLRDRPALHDARAAPPTPCSSSTTPRCPRASRPRSSPRSEGV